jgi:hypothetical protein
MQRGYKFTGRHAERNKHLYELYRRGARADALALACGLTRARFYQIIAEGNGGQCALAMSMNCLPIAADRDARKSRGLRVGGFMRRVLPA